MIAKEFSVHCAATQPLCEGTLCLRMRLTPPSHTRLATVLCSTTELNFQLLTMSLISINAASHTVGLKMRKRLVVLQALAILFTVFQYGMRAAGQEEGGYSNEILSSVFSPYLMARYVGIC